MYNYRIEIEYDGGRYDGWQKTARICQHDREPDCVR